MWFGRTIRVIWVVLLCIPALVLVGRICLSDLPQRAKLYHENGSANSYDKQSPRLDAFVDSGENELLLVELSHPGGAPSTCRITILGLVKQARMRLATPMRYHFPVFLNPGFCQSRSDSTPGRCPGCILCPHARGGSRRAGAAQCQLC